MKLFHGSHNHTTTPHLGMCFTEDEDIAAVYATARGTVIEVDIDLDDLNVVTLDDEYDHDANTAPGDNGEGYGADVIVFEDENERGITHTTYRLMTQAAIDAVRSVTIMEE